MVHIAVHGLVSEGGQAEKSTPGPAYVIDENQILLMTELISLISSQQTQDIE